MEGHCKRCGSNVNSGLFFKDDELVGRIATAFPCGLCLECYAWAIYALCRPKDEAPMMFQGISIIMRKIDYSPNRALRAEERLDKEVDRLDERCNQLNDAIAALEGKRV